MTKPEIFGASVAPELLDEELELLEDELLDEELELLEDELLDEGLELLEAEPLELLDELELPLLPPPQAVAIRLVVSKIAPKRSHDWVWRGVVSSI
jgi:hypothetical protein